MALENVGTADAKGKLRCDSCGYVGDIETYAPSMSVYSDVRCPECNSTNNDHNKEYLRRMNESFKKTE